MEIVSALWRWLNAQAGWLLLGGLAAVAFLNWHKWRQDRALVRRAQGAGRERTEWHTMPHVSVLVAAWNEADMIEEHIEAFRRLQYPNKQLVLCAGGSDGTFTIAQKHAGEPVVVLEQHAGEGKQRALQKCFPHATGEFVCLTDADCLLDSGSFYQILAPLIEDGEDAATGRFRPLQAQLNTTFVFYQWAINDFAAARRPGYAGGLEGRNCAVTRRALDLVGGFKETVSTGTDYFLARKLLRAGYRIRYVPGSFVETSYPEDFRTYMRKCSRWVRNPLIHGPRFGAWRGVWAALRTMSVGIGLLSWPLTFLWTGRLGGCLWLTFLAYALLARVRYVAFAERASDVHLGSRVYARLPLYMFVDFCAWALALVESLLPTRWSHW